MVQILRQTQSTIFTNVYLFGNFHGLLTKIFLHEIIVDVVVHPADLILWVLSLNLLCHLSMISIWCGNKIKVPLVWWSQRVNITFCGHSSKFEVLVPLVILYASNNVSHRLTCCIIQKIFVKISPPFFFFLLFLIWNRISCKRVVLHLFKESQWAKLTVLWTFGLNIANLSKNLINHTMGTCLWVRNSSGINLWPLNSPMLERI